MTRSKKRTHCPVVPSPDLSGEATIHCMLFSDRVSEKLCLLRKKELNRKGVFSCEGCPMDTIITQRMRLVAEVLGTRRDPDG